MFSLSWLDCANVTCLGGHCRYPFWFFNLLVNFFLSKNLFEVKMGGNYARLKCFNLNLQYPFLKWIWDHECPGELKRPTYQTHHTSTYTVWYNNQTYESNQKHKHKRENGKYNTNGEHIVRLVFINLYILFYFRQLLDIMSWYVICIIYGI